MSCRALATSLLLPVLAACAVEPPDDEAPLDEVGLCLASLGGHEVCDGEDNDCDGAVDESCGPIDVDQLTGYACPGIAGAGRLAVGDASTVFILKTATGTLNRVTASGALAVDVNSSMPPSASQIGRIPTGNLFVYGSRYLGDAQVGYQVRADSLDPATGKRISTFVYAPTTVAYGAFTVDPLGRPLLGSDPDDDIRLYWAGKTGGWADAVDTVSHMVAGGASGEVIYYTAPSGLYLTTPPFVPAQELTMARATASSGTVALDDQGRVYWSRASLLSKVSTIDRFDADGGGRVTLAGGMFSYPVAYDPETHELVVWSNTTGRPCPSGTYGLLKRIEL